MAAAHPAMAAPPLRKTQDPKRRFRRRRHQPGQDGIFQSTLAGHEHDCAVHTAHQRRCRHLDQLLLQPFLGYLSWWLHRNCIYICLYSQINTYKNQE